MVRVRLFVLSGIAAGTLFLVAQNQGPVQGEPTYQYLRDSYVQKKEDFVMPQPWVQWSLEDTYCMEKNIFHEAGVESFEGKLAVGTVTINRLIDGRWGDTICEVVYAHKQFSWTLSEQLRAEKPTGELWIESQEAAAWVLQAYRHPHTDSSLHYHADYVSPRWARQKTEVATIGAHIFYDN